MTDALSPDTGALDPPAMLTALFHPRPNGAPAVPASTQDLQIPVAEGVALGARWHPAGADAALLLCFHGNGERAEAYDDLGALSVQRGLHLVVVDDRGYGRSTGRPTVSAMRADSGVVLDFITAWRHQQRQTGPLIVLGRSLGSAPALELAYRRPEALAGLILDSAFAHTGPLLRRLGVPGKRFDEAQGFRQLDKIRTFTKPTLILHAEHDHLIPFSEGRALYKARPARDKRLVQIRGADHHTIFAVGERPYLDAVQSFADPARFQTLA
ncbi:MAG: alpha/beta fold hydrolase [Gammaproteobacteria bacterium]|nr:alpha/beta fold hydrolase [Gammaproteobacteria bacterium]